MNRQACRACGASLDQPEAFVRTEVCDDCGRAFDTGTAFIVHLHRVSITADGRQASSDVCDDCARKRGFGDFIDSQRDRA